MQRTPQPRRHSDGVRQMALGRWIHAIGNEQMAPCRWCQADGVRQTVSGR